MFEYILVRGLDEVNKRGKLGWQVHTAFHINSGAPRAVYEYLLEKKVVLND